MLMRNADFGGGAGGDGAAGGAIASTGCVGTSTSGSGAGPVAQAASNRAVATPAPQRAIPRTLVTEANPEDIDFRGPEAAAQHVQFIQIVGRADVDAVVVSIIDLDALNM